MHILYNLNEVSIFTFQIQQFKRFNIFNTPFPLLSMVSMSNIFQKILQIVLIAAAFKCTDGIK